jgi:hypothetical protein
VSGTFRITDPLQLLLQLLEDNGGSLKLLPAKWMLEHRLSMRIGVESWTCWIKSLADRGIIVFTPQPANMDTISLPSQRRDPL